MSWDQTMRFNFVMIDVYYWTKLHRILQNTTLTWQMTVAFFVLSGAKFLHPMKAFLSLTDSFGNDFNLNQACMHAWL